MLGKSYQHRCGNSKQRLHYFSPHEPFTEDNYEEVLEKMKRKHCGKKSEKKRRVKTKLENPQPPCDERCSDVETLRKPSKTECGKPAKLECETFEPQEHKHWVTKDKYPCCDQDSDEEEPSVNVRPSASVKPINDSKQTVETKPPKKGFFASCCPCCVKKPKARPASAIVRTSRPPSCSDDPNNRLTQTTPQDFELAKKRLKEAIKEEKKRQKLSGKKGGKTLDAENCAEEPKVKTRSKSSLKNTRCNPKEEDQVSYCCEEDEKPKKSSKSKKSSCNDRKSKCSKSKSDEDDSDQGNECAEEEKNRKPQPTACLKDKEKCEAEYRRARDKYRQKRKRMEQEINKKMEKQMKKQQKG